MGEEIGRASLSGLDWAVVSAYLAGLVAFGLAKTRRHAEAEEYFLASRQSTWPAIGLSLIASNLSSTPLVGLAGAAYGMGISAYDYEWSAVVVLVFFSAFLLPFILASRVYTLPEYLERRYDRRARIYLAVLTLCLIMAIEVAGVLYSGSLVCRLLVPDAPLWSIVTVLAGAAAIYTVLGGLRAVINTQAVQAVVLFIGASAIAVAAFARAGGWEAVMHGVEPGRLSLIRPIGDPGVPWPGLLLGIPLLGFYYWCTNQAIVQRVLSARDIDHGRRGVLLAGALKLPVLFLMVLPGICALLLFPGLKQPDVAYPALIFGLLPAGIKGLVIASFAAATMASVASSLNAAATLFTMDIVRPALLGADESRLVAIGRVATAFCLVLSVAWAPQIETFGVLWQYLQAILAYAVPPTVAVVLVGMFWRGANAAGAAATLSLGSACSVALFLSNAVFGWTSMHFLYAAPLLFAIDVMILVVVSRLAAPSAGEASDSLVWSPCFYREETQRLAGVPVWRNHRVLSLALLALTALVVFLFR